MTDDSPSRFQLAALLPSLGRWALVDGTLTDDLTDGMSMLGAACSEEMKHVVLVDHFYADCAASADWDTSSESVTFKRYFDDGQIV